MRRGGRLAVALMMGGCAAAGPAPSAARAPALGAEPKADTRAADAQAGAAGGRDGSGLRDDGVCMTGAPSWEDARAWALSFRLPAVRATTTPVVQAAEGPPLELGRRRVRVLRQVVHYGEGAPVVARRFVFVTHPSGEVAGCAVEEERPRLPHHDAAIVASVESLTEGEHVSFAVQSELRGGLTHGERHTFCRIDGETLGCASLGRVAPWYRATADGLRVQYGGALERAEIALAGSHSRWFDAAGRAQTAAGRSAGWRQTHPDETPSGELEERLVPLRAETAGNWTGPWEGSGACFWHAADWTTALLWLESLAIPPPANGHPEGEVERGIREQRVSGSTPRGAVRTYAQVVRARGITFVRHAVMAETPSGITGCVVHDDQLMYGYLEAPTPVAKSLTLRGDDAFAYEARHTWHTATANEARASWQVVCAFDETRLGCLAIEERRDDYAYDSETRTDRPVVVEPTLRWQDRELTFTFGEDRGTARIEPGGAKNVSRGRVHPVVVEATLKR